MSDQGAEAHSLKMVLDDLYRGWLRYDLWLLLGWRDVISKYRRSYLGSLWITTSMIFVAGVMGTLYSVIMHKPMHEYIPYLLSGFIVWNLLQSLVTEGCQVFTGNAAAIKEIPAPASVYVYRMIWRNVLVLVHSLVVYILALFVFPVSPFPAVMMIFPGLVLILINGIWIGLLFGLINVRFRDFYQLINHGMRLVFFLTPVIWYAQSLTGLRSAFVYLNPFYYFIELLRAPMLGELPSQHVIGVIICITVLGWAVTLPLYALGRRQIAYWV